MAPSSTFSARGRRGLAVGALLCAAAATVCFVGSPAPAAQLPLHGRVVVLDPGHNGRNFAHPAIINRLVNAGNGVRKACNTTGTATNSGYTEAAYAFNVAQRTATVLRQRGATVYLTRPDNAGVGPCINVRGATAARRGADVLLSIHADGNTSRGARGFHVIASSHQVGGTRVTAQGRDLARMLRSAFRSGTGMPYATYVAGGDALDVRSDLGTLNLAAVPAVMIETGNMRNATDARLLRSAAFRQAEAVAFADALQRFLATR